MKGDQKLIIGVIVATVVLFIGILWLTSTTQTIPQVDQAEIVGDAPHAKGASADEAILTIVEFSDFQCPACKAAEPLLTQFVEENAGEVRLVYRHYPLNTIHPNARYAAIASEIAAEYGLFWEYHDELFAGQTGWSAESDPTDIFVGYAETVGIDVEEFRTTLENAQDGSVYAQAVQTDQAKASELNLDSTPSFYFNGTLIAGVPTEALLQQQLVDAREVSQ